MSLIVKHRAQAGVKNRRVATRQRSQVRRRGAWGLIFRWAAALGAKVARVLVPGPRLRTGSRRQINELIAKMKADPPALAAMIAETWLVTVRVRHDPWSADVAPRISVKWGNEHAVEQAPSCAPAAEQMVLQADTVTHAVRVAFLAPGSQESFPGNSSPPKGTCGLAVRNESKRRILAWMAFRR
jgi:hypothetical protein